MNKDLIKSINLLINKSYEERKKLVLAKSESGEIEECISAAEDLLDFMNRYRNCALKNYYDEDITKAITKLNGATYDTKGLLFPKTKFRVAYVFNKFNDTGGASFSQRLMLEKPHLDSFEIEQFALVTRESEREFTRKQRYQYMKKNIPLKDFGFVPEKSTIQVKAEYIQNWLYDREIDFAIVQPDVVTMYAMASKPVLIDAWFSADWHTYTTGPGGGDNTLLMTTDQFLKYKFKDESHKSKCINIRLPLQSKEYAESIPPTNRSEWGIPSGTIISATTNLWKCSFGDDTTLFESIAELIRKNKNYYHIFAGTARGLDSLNSFIGRNPELEGRMIYVGVIPNIYKLLNEIDFYINSYPVSGASNTEAALCGKPSIDFLGDRDLSGHGPELLRSFECEVMSCEEFHELGEKMIKSKDFRLALGKNLQEKVIADLSKETVVPDKLLKTLVRQFNAKLNGHVVSKKVNLKDCLDYEKIISVYKTVIQENWNFEEKKEFLEKIIENYPTKIFGPIKLIELACEKIDLEIEMLISPNNSLSDHVLNDYRVQFMIGVLGLRKRKEAEADKAFSKCLYCCPKSHREEMESEIDLVRSNGLSRENFSFFYDY